MRLKYTSSKAK